jgi:hypothetical protein
VSAPIARKKSSNATVIAIASIASSPMMAVGIAVAAKTALAIQPKTMMARPGGVSGLSLSSARSGVVT